MTMTRREVVSALAVSGAALAVGVQPLTAAPAEPVVYTLPPLPYPAAALEPNIDALTMGIHHGKHHQAYVTNLNAALSGSSTGAEPLEHILSDLARVPESIRSAVRNNGGGHVNHSQFWTLLAPNAGGPPTGAIADAITGAFGGFDAFKQQFGKAAAGRFGSGWVWLSEDHGRLVIHSTANQDTPAMEGKRGLFGLDVWEHAYYLKYQNRRADYVGAFWNVINWTEVNRRLRG